MKFSFSVLVAFAIAVAGNPVSAAVVAGGNELERAATSGDSATMVRGAASNATTTAIAEEELHCENGSGIEFFR
ncbi:hypothetical protein DFH06DRAFT_769673 [Mycena polygramma]|nr:hypothetical protein DFH06DRAFT_769673 [Mycena polygramma]